MERRPDKALVPSSGNQCLVRYAYQAYTRYNTRQIIAILLHSLHIHATMIASAALAGIVEAIVSERAIP